MYDNVISILHAYPYWLPNEPLPVTCGSLEGLTLEDTRWACCRRSALVGVYVLC